MRACFKRTVSRQARLLSISVAAVMLAGIFSVWAPGGNVGGEPAAPDDITVATHVVISEVLYDDDGTNDQQFIELYNPTSSPVDISGWTIEEWEGSTAIVLDHTKVIPSSPAQIIDPYGYYLLAQFGTADGTLNGDITTAWGYTIQADAGATGAKVVMSWVQANEVGPDAIMLKDDTGAYVDAVEYGTAVGSYGWADDPNTVDVVEASLERMSGTTHNEAQGNGQDTDDNSVDFRVREFAVNGQYPQPQNSDSTTETPPGDIVPPSLSYALSTSTTTIEARFNEMVNEADAETLSKWKIVSLTGFDTVAPHIVECRATSTTSVEVTFSEAVLAVDANDETNYEIVTGLGITNAALNTELTTVNLTTAVQIVGATYTLLVSWINDTASPPNVIDMYSEASFNGGGGSGTMRVAFIDVEQGDSTLVVSPSGGAMLFDGGDTGSGAHILSTLGSYGVSQLMYTVASHYHEDHIGGMDEVIAGLGGIGSVTGTCFDRGGSYSSSIYDEYVDAVLTKRMALTEGTVLDLGGGVTATCIAVNGNGVNPSSENDLGVVMRVDYQNFQMYLGGDLGGFNANDYKDIESTVANDIGKVEVYQVDHHGSMYSSNSYFLGVLEPLVSVFSVGDSNGYGHVHQEAFDRVAAVGSYMYYTNSGEGAVPTAGVGEVVHGDVDLTTDGQGFVVEGDNYVCHDQVDSVAPTVIDVRATDLTHVEVTFSESVNQADAETESNYALAGGIGTNPSSAILKADLRTVNLTTGTQVEGTTYTITISNIRDRAAPANVILAGTVVTFTGGRPVLQITGATLDPDDQSLVYLTTSVQSRTGYALYAYNIRDQATVPNNRAQTTVNFVGGGYHLTINEIYYDATGADDNREWWEIHNPEANGVNLKSWKFSDDDFFFGLPPEDIVINPGQYSTAAFNGHEFRNMYGYYPDFEVLGSTPSKDLSFSGSVYSSLSNTADVMAISNSRGQVYDAVAWGTMTYGSMTNYTAPDVASGSSLKRIVPGREGPEGVLATSPTGADEQSEKQNSGVFGAGVPSPQTLDSQPPTIGNVAWQVGSVYAVVYWNTTEAGWPEINPEADSKVVYSSGLNPDAGANSSAYAAERTTEHEIMLYPLNPSTTYEFYISSTDGKGQTSLDKNGGAYYQFTTTAADSTAPAISNVQVVPYDTSALITWTTDELSSSTVRYGTSVPPSLTQTNLHLTTSHAIMLYGLAPSTLYRFSVGSKNPAGLASVSDNGGAYFQFTTTATEVVNFYMGNMDSFTEFSSGFDKPSRAYDYANGGPGAAGTDHLVISEVFYDQVSTDNANQCFVELYNPTPSAITFSGANTWYIKHINGLNDAVLKTHTISSGTIPSHGFFLVGGSSVSPTPNLVDGYDYQNGPDSIRLEHPDGTFIDVVGYVGSGTGTTFDGPENYETSPTSNTIGEGHSWERRSGSVHDDSAGNQRDTNDNSVDFYERTTPQPQNSASPIENPPTGTGPDIDVLGINDYSYQLTGAEYSIGKAEQANKTVAGDFVALYGQQLWGGSEGYGHISAYAENVAEVASGLALQDVEAAYDWIADHQAIGIFDAPGYQGAFDEMAYNATADQFMAALEVLGGYMYFDYEYYYNLALRNGWHVGAIGGQRNEFGNWGNKVNAYDKIDMTMFRAPSLTTTNILDSLRTMDFYAYEADTPWPPSEDPVVTDPIMLNFSINGYDMGSQFTDCNALTFQVGLDADNPFHTIEVVEDGAVVMTWSGTPTSDLDWTFTHQPQKGHHYYYIRGNQTDANDSKFWSSPIWVYNPALALPDLAPEITDVKHTPNSPLSTNAVVVTARIEDDENAVSRARLWYSINGGAYSSALMYDDGAAPDAAPGDGIFSAQLAARPDGTNVHYYVDALDDAGLSDVSPSDAPTHYYSYYVGPRVLINEVYVDAFDTYPSLGQEESEFIELYNPTGGAVSLVGWTISNLYYPDTWTWPTGASIPANDYLVIARDSRYDAGGGGYRGDGDLTTDQAIPEWEMLDTADVYDDTGSGNMTLVAGNTEIKLNNGYDGLELKNAAGTTLDAMEYGSDYSWVTGLPALIPPQDCSLTRDFDHTDTDNSYADFSVIGNPTPGVAVTIPTIQNVVHQPACPRSTQAVNVSARIRDDASVPSGAIWYSVNGGAYVSVAMNDAGTAPDKVSGDRTYTGAIPAQAAGSVVKYYVDGYTGPIHSYSPFGAPATYSYIYTVWEHVVVSEVYYNANTYVNEVRNSRYLEIYNPSASSVDISNWQLWGEPLSWARKWSFPAATSIAGGDALVVAMTAGDSGTTGFYTEFGALPDFELYDPTMTSEAYTDHDNPSVPNMVLVVDDAYDDQLGLEGPTYFDALYLVNAAGSTVDSMEYGIEGENVPGYAAAETTTGYSLSRDALGTDTDNSAVDFTSKSPTPGVIAAAPSIASIAVVAGWNLVSVPITAADTRLPYALTDTVNAGAGLVQWTRAVWYNPATPADPWKQYNTAWLTALNDLPSVSRTMGVWLFVSSVGDGLITVGGANYTTPTSTNIALKAGWNLVGFPSDDATYTLAMLKAACPSVTIVEKFDGAQTYKTVTMADADAFAQGRAYWVYAASDTIWAKSW
jgi:beta-lactamase superfamily II metal-dependent hydrolase